MSLRIDKLIHLGSLCGVVVVFFHFFFLISFHPFHLSVIFFLICSYSLSSIHFILIYILFVHPIIINYTHFGEYDIHNLANEKKKRPAFFNSFSTLFFSFSFRLLFVFHIFKILINNIRSSSLNYLI